MALRTILSELGCLPVSAMIHIPKAQEVLNRDGTIFQNNSSSSNDNNNNDNKYENENEKEDEEKWRKYCARCFSQLEWWAVAAKNHREVVNPFDESPVFGKAPRERNAPT